MDSYYDTGVVDEDEGPIIQEIPDALMVGDYIEIHGICRGPEVIVQLLSRKDPKVLPLHVRLAAGGPVLVKSQSREKVDRQEHNVRMGLQPNMDFELCIYATEAGYEVKLNKQSVCLQKHLVKLEDVSGISMDGDADFTSVEFKDIYGDEEDEDQYARAAPGPGLMRVQEMRESFSRQRGSPIIIRSSIRKSQRSEDSRTLGKQPWTTSADLSRPDPDVDQGREMLVRESVKPIDQTQVNAPIPVETRQSVNTASPKSKSRHSWKIGGRKSISLEEDKLLNSPHASKYVYNADTHTGTYRLIDESYGNSASLGTLNASSGSLADPKKKKRTSLFGKLRKSKGSEPDISAEGSEKTKRRGLKNPFKIRKSITLNPNNRQSYSMPDVSARESTEYSRISVDTAPKSSRYLGAAADRAPIRGPVPKSVRKEPAPEIAGYLAGQKAIPEFEDFNLTDRDHREEPTSTLATHPASGRGSTYAGSASDRKLKGPAPELADILLESRRAGFDQTTTLTGGQSVHSVDDVTRESVYAPPYQVEPVAAKRSQAAPAKLKGPAPEIASELHDRHIGTLSLLPDATLTGGQMQAKQPIDRIERSVVDSGPLRSEPITVTPNYQSQPLYATRPVSVDRNPPTRKDSDVSSVQSDNEYYLEVGKSNYYFERMRSLKNYRSRRSRKSDSATGLSREDSARSSISSLKADDRVIYASGGRREEKPWVNGYSKDTDLYQPTPSRPKVYAAPASALEQPEQIELSLDKEQLQRLKNCFDLPVALTPGRSAVLCGHFTASPDLNPCLIYLKYPHEEELLLEIGTNGSLSIHRVDGNSTDLCATLSCPQNSLENVDLQQFTVSLHAREEYFGVTLNDYLTALVRRNSHITSLNRIELSSDCCAELDYVCVNRELTTPITVSFPDGLVDGLMQKLELRLRADADSQQILLEFETNIGEKFILVLELADGLIFARGCLGETEREMLPFVPEQIQQLTILKTYMEDSLTVIANQQQIFNQQLPILHANDKLKKVRLSGDMLLLDTEAE